MLSNYFGELTLFKGNLLFWINQAYVQHPYECNMLLFFSLKFSQDGDIFNHFDLCIASVSVFISRIAFISLICIYYLFYIMDIPQIGIVKHFCPQIYHLFMSHLNIKGVFLQHFFLTLNLIKYFIPQNLLSCIFKLKPSK